MKLSIILFMVISAVVSLVEHVATVASPTNACPPNPFVSELKRNNVLLFETPADYHGSSCGNEWKEFRVCCSEKDLVEYAKKDQDNITRAAEGLNQSFLELLSTFQTIRSTPIKASSSDIQGFNLKQQVIYTFMNSSYTGKF